MFFFEFNSIIDFVNYEKKFSSTFFRIHKVRDYLAIVWCDQSKTHTVEKVWRKKNLKFQSLKKSSHKNHVIKLLKQTKQKKILPHHFFCFFWPGPVLPNFMNSIHFEFKSNDDDDDDEMEMWKSHWALLVIDLHKFYSTMAYCFCYGIQFFFIFK